MASSSLNIACFTWIKICVFFCVIACKVLSFDITCFSFFLKHPLSFSKQPETKKIVYHWELLNYSKCSVLHNLENVFCLLLKGISRNLLYHFQCFYRSAYITVFVINKIYSPSSTGLHNLFNFCNLMFGKILKCIENL